MAAAFKVPAIGLFGPTSAERHAPPNPKQALFQKKVDCGPCYSRECVTKTHECMELITTNEVFLAVKKYLDDRIRVTQNIENQESEAKEVDLSLEAKE